MSKLLNLLQGYVDLDVTGAFPERLLNLCAQERLRFWRLNWQDETSFTFRVYLRDRKRLDELAQRAMCTLTEGRRQGAPVAAERVSRRLGFMLGLSVCLLAVSFLSRFLLVIEVVGNETVPSAVILSELQRVGVRPGAYGPAIPQKEVANAALLGLPQLSYLAINITGTRAEVVVREAERTPELLAENIPADVVATTDGVIEHIHPESGRAMFADGDAVVKGDILISGDMDLKEPEGVTMDLGRLVVHAAGVVTARTWRTLEETIPLTVQVKEYTGEEHKWYAAKILWRQVEFFQNSSIFSGRYDKIAETSEWNLWGRTLPFALTTTTLREYTLREEPLDQNEAAGRLEELLLARLEELMASRNGTVLSTSFMTRIRDGRLTVTLQAECREEIGRTVEREGTTGHIPGTPQDGERD